MRHLASIWKESERYLGAISLSSSLAHKYVFYISDVCHTKYWFGVGKRRN